MMRLVDKLRLEKVKSHKKVFEKGAIYYLGLRLKKIYKITFLSLIKVKKYKNYKDNFITIINFYLISNLFFSFVK